MINSVQTACLRPRCNVSATLTWDNADTMSVCYSCADIAVKNFNRDWTMRCYFMKDGHIAGVEFLTAANDEALVAQAKKFFEKKRKDGAEGFEVWDGPRFVYRYPEN
jgi:hypothetical protein